MNWQWQVIIESIPKMLEAAMLTIVLVVLSGILGLIFGMVIGLLRSHTSKLVNTLPFLFIFFFRGTPLLVQLFLVYFGLAQFDFIKDSFLWEPILSKPFWCAIIAFILNTSAYIAEIVRGAVAAIPKGELEAADAIGMSAMQKLRRITLPRAFGIMIPAYSNEVIFMLKGSALASTITMYELMGMTDKIRGETFADFEMLTFAGVLYLLISWLILGGFRLLEKRFNRHNSYVPADIKHTANIL